VRKKKLGRLRNLGIVSLLLAGTVIPVAATEAAAASCDGKGQTWPSAGSVKMSASPRYTVTFTFSLTASELCQLQASEYLELEYSLYGFKTAKNWDNYRVDSTNLPNAIKDVSFLDSANQPTPAATAIQTKNLVAGTTYHLTLSWQEPLQQGQQPEIIFRWAPSHWASKLKPDEAVCFPSYKTTGNKAWCVFPDGNGADTVVLFKSATFQGGSSDGKRPISADSSFVWYRTTGSPPFVVTSGSVATPTPGNKLPVADFTWSRKPGPGNQIVLDGSKSYDPDGSIKSWMWYNGIPSAATGSNPTISLGSATSAQITLTVTDNKGSTGTVRKTVAAPNRTPVIIGSNPAGGATAGDNTPALSVSAKDDDGDALQYEFRIQGPSTDVSSGWIGQTSWVVPPSRLDPGTRYSWTVRARDSHGAMTPARTSTLQIAVLPTASELVSTSTGDGYWQVATDGGVFTHGSAKFHGSLPGLGVKVDNIIGLARTPTDNGYWLVGRDGGVFAFGDAVYANSLPGLNIRVANIVGMAPTRDGKGYWLVGSDGGVFAFGSARFYGSMGGKPLNKPVEAIAPTAGSDGYWLVAQDGGVFAFGNAPFHGSMGGKPLNKPVVDIDVTPDGGGYWLTAEDGGVFAFGNAPFHGSMAGKPLNGRITGMAPTPAGDGYWLNACDGGIFAFGKAPFYGSKPRYGCRGVFYN
jgi:hypothetical protein